MKRLEISLILVTTVVFISGAALAKSPEAMEGKNAMPVAEDAMMMNNMEKPGNTETMDKMDSMGKNDNMDNMEDMKEKGSVGNAEKTESINNMEKMMEETAAKGGKSTSTAMATMAPTDSGSPIKGIVKFEQEDKGVKMTALFSGVPNPGKHGIHIHEKGSCDDKGKGAGGHYDPHGTKHGFLPTDGITQAHCGDMGNIMIDEKGNGSLTLDMPGLSISGDNAVVGRSVILHEQEDNFGQPTGNAGGRIACGVITAAAK